MTAFNNYRASNPPAQYRLRNSLLMFVDFSQPHTELRGHLIDVDTMRAVIAPFLVAHGVKEPKGASDDEKLRLGMGIVNGRLSPLTPRQFSNRPGSELSSLGFAVTSGVDRSPNWGWRIWLDGRSGREFNSNMRRRLVYIHPYEAVWHERGRVAAIGASDGCPAVLPEVFEQLRSRIDRGSAVYIWAPTATIKRDPVFLGSRVA